MKLSWPERRDRGNLWWLTGSRVGVPFRYCSRNAVVMGRFAGDLKETDKFRV